MVNFGNPYRVSVPVDDRCEIVTGGERTEVVKELKYLRTVLSKHGQMEEVREMEECYRISSKGYEREECVHGSKERLKE